MRRQTIIANKRLQFFQCPAPASALVGVGVVVASFHQALKAILLIFFSSSLWLSIGTLTVPHKLEVCF